MVSGGDRIPKRKPDQTTVVRIELQDTERAMLESYLMTWQVGKAATALDQFLSFENLYIGVTILEMLTGREILPGTPNDIYDLIDQIRDYLNTLTAEGRKELGEQVVEFSLGAAPTGRPELGFGIWFGQWLTDLLFSSQKVAEP